MSFTNTTEHYGLPQYVGTDKPTQLGDFNMAMETIDKQMYKNAQLAGANNANVSELTTELNTLKTSVATANQNVSQLEQQATTLSSQLNTVTENANSALTTAQGAQQSAQTANTTANAAQSTASQANTQGTTNASSIADLDERVKVLEGNAPEPEPVPPLFQIVSGSHSVNKGGPTTTTWTAPNSAGFTSGKSHSVGMLSASGGSGGGETSNSNCSGSVSLISVTSELLTFRLTGNFTSNNPNNTGFNVNGVIAVETN